MDWIPAADCDCFFCRQMKVHRSSHADFVPVTGRLLVAESLNPADRLARRACMTCGHVEEEKR